MTYKTLMVHLDSESQAPCVLKAAVQLAEKHNAHLIGTYITHPMEVYSSRATVMAMTSEIMVVLAKEERAREKRLRKLFTDATDNQYFVAEWRFLERREGPVADVLLSMATAVDALIIGGPLHDQPLALRSNFVERVVSESARPVFVIPEDYNADSFGSHIFIAFDGSREASRAVFDSLPQLALAEKIWLHRETSDEAESELLMSQTSELANTLSHHNIEVEVTFGHAGGRKAGAAVLQNAADHGANCLVMGGFGKNRLARVFLGSTSDEALARVAMPVVMSH